MIAEKKIILFNSNVSNLIELTLLFLQAAGQPGVMHVPYNPAGTTATVQQFQVNGQPSTLAL